MNINYIKKIIKLKQVKKLFLFRKKQNIYFRIDSQVAIIDIEQSPPPLLPIQQAAESNTWLVLFGALIDKEKLFLGRQLT